MDRPDHQKINKIIIPLIFPARNVNQLTTTFTMFALDVNFALEISNIAPIFFPPSFFCHQRGTAALYFVYMAMEEEMEKNKDHPHVAPIYFPADLYRREALARDLEYLYGDDWESHVSKKHMGKNVSRKFCSFKLFLKVKKRILNALRAGKSFFLAAFALTDQPVCRHQALRGPHPRGGPKGPGAVGSPLLHPLHGRPFRWADPEESGPESSEAPLHRRGSELLPV